MASEHFDDLSTRYGELKNLESPDQLFSLLKESGMMRGPKVENGESLIWDMPMVTRLFKEFKKGLHKFVTIQHGDGKERIVESRQKNVFADITCVIGGKEMKMKQYVQMIKRNRDGSNSIETPEIPKKGTSSVSDRLPVDKVVDPLASIKEAILRETGFTSDQYEITSEPIQEIQDQLSGGYPNLPVHLEITRYKIKYLGDIKDSYIKDDKPIESGAVEEIKRHIFRWVEA